MSRRIVRNVVVIDEEKCDGCGACIPSCAEGAMQVIDGKARLVDDRLCDGLGHCLGACPRGAISVVQREAEVCAHRVPPGPRRPSPAARPARQACGCPGAAPRTLAADASGLGERAARPAGPATASCLRHWPVQLHLVPVESPMWPASEVLIAADCVGFCMPDFHARLLAGRALAVGCPKLDDLAGYAEKLTAVFARHAPRSVTVAYMEVPCCRGLVQTVRAALDAAGRADLPLQAVLVGIDGTIMRSEIHSGKMAP